MDWIARSSQRKQHQVPLATRLKIGTSASIASKTVTNHTVLSEVMPALCDMRGSLMRTAEG